MLHESGELDEAEALLRRAVDVFESVLPAGHPNTENSRDFLEVVKSERRAKRAKRAES